MLNPRARAVVLLACFPCLAHFAEPVRGQCPPREIRPDPSSMQLRFGAAMDVDSGTLLVGAPGTEFWRGAAYVFNLVDGQWRQEAVLTGQDTNSFDYFGDCVVNTVDFLKFFNAFNDGC